MFRLGRSCWDMAELPEEMGLSVSDGTDNEAPGDGADGRGGPGVPNSPLFGTCCNELKEALAGQGFEPLFVVGEDGILYMSVGELLMDENHLSYVEHPVFFCPFCGTKLQSRDEIMARLSADEAAAGEEDKGA
jgi:hypothetical protein